MVAMKVRVVTKLSPLPCSAFPQLVPFLSPRISYTKLKLSGGVPELLCIVAVAGAGQILKTIDKNAI